MATRMLPLDIIIDKLSPPPNSPKKKKKGSTTGEECATLCCDAFVDGFGYDTATHDYKLVMMGDLISLGYTEFTVL